MVLRCCSSRTQLCSGAVEVFPCAAANLCVDRCFYNVLFRPTRRAATYLVWNLLIVACSQCSSSFKPNSLCTIFPLALRPAIVSSALQPCPLMAIVSLALGLCSLMVILSLALRLHPFRAIVSSALQLHPLMAIVLSALRLRPLTAILSLALQPCPLTAISIFYLPHGDNQIFFRLLTAISIFYFSHNNNWFVFRLHGNLHLTAVFPSALPLHIMAIIYPALQLCLMAMSTFSLPQGDDGLFLHFTTLPPFASPGDIITNLPPLQAMSSSIWPLHEISSSICLSRWYHQQFASPGNNIINSASPGQYHHWFSLTVVSLQAVVSSILPHGRAPPAILFSIQPNSYVILAQYFSIQPNGCTSPGKLLLITHQCFLQATFCKLLWRPFLPSSSRLPFIGVGVVFLATPCNDQPFASCLMLSLKASIHWHWYCFSYNTGWGTAFVSFLMLTHQDDRSCFGLGLSDFEFNWYLNLRETPLELVCYGHPQSTYWTSYFKVFFDQRSQISIQWILIKYRYKSFKCAFNNFKDPIQDISRLTYCSGRNFTSDARPAQFTCFPLGINVPD